MRNGLQLGPTLMLGMATCLVPLFIVQKMFRQNAPVVILLTMAAFMLILFRGGPPAKPA